MDLIHAALTDWNRELPTLRIPVDRLVLAKRRWRGAAEDGREFGFALDAPLADQTAVFAADTGVYIVAQKYEPVLEIALSADAPAAARLGWIIGNLHFPLEVAVPIVRVTDDPALRQLFAREQIAYTQCKRVFRPLSGGHHH